MNEQQFIRDALTVLDTVPDEEFNLNLCYEVEPCGCVAYHMAKRGIIPLKRFHPDDMRRWLRTQELSFKLLIILGFSRNSEAYYNVKTLADVPKTIVMEKLNDYLLQM